MIRNDILALIVEWQNVILRVDGIEREYERRVLETIGTKPIKMIKDYLMQGNNLLLTVDDDEGDILQGEARILKRNLLKWLLGLT